MKSFMHIFNMYACCPCPKCRGNHRYVISAGGPFMMSGGSIHCDDCGHESEARKYQYFGDTYYDSTCEDCDNAYGMEQLKELSTPR
jgi:hypothetical protein